MYQAMVGVLAQIHAVDVKKVGELLIETKSFLVRLYQVGNTSSRKITEVKQQKPLGWVTYDHSRLKLMLLSIFVYIYPEIFYIITQ